MGNMYLKYILRDLLALCFLLSSLSLRGAGDVERWEEINVANQKIDEFEISKLESLAKAGDVVAQRSLGYAYYFGKKVTQSYTESIRWFTEASVKNDFTSTFYLAGMYLSGKGTSRDTVKGVELWKRCAEMGSPTAMISLSDCYRNGVGVSVDLEQARVYSLMASEMGDKYGMIYLSEILLLLNRPNEAISWLEKAAVVDSQARYRLYCVYSNGRFIPVDDLNSYVWCTVMDRVDFSKKDADRRDPRLPVNAERDVLRCRDNLNAKLGSEEIKKAKSIADDWIGKIKKPGR